MTISTQCLDCKHYTGLSTCNAFPEKIPQEIFDGTVEHVIPYPGDGGIMFDPIDTELSADQKTAVVSKLEDKGLLKGEKGTKLEWRTVNRDGKTFRQRFRVGQKESDDVGTKMTKENVESITSLGDMNIFGGLNRHFTHVVNFKDNTKGIYKTTDMGSIQGEVNVQSIQSILGWNIAPETVADDFGKGFGSCQKFIDGDVELGLSFTPRGELVEKIKEDQYDNCAKIFVMDLLCGNPDRSKNNAKVDDSGKVWAIDNDIWGRETKYTPDVKRDFRKCSMQTWLMFNTDVKKATFQKYVNKHIDNMIEHEQKINDHFTSLLEDVDRFKPQPEKDGGNLQVPISERIQNIKDNLAIIVNYGRGN